MVTDNATVVRVLREVARVYHEWMDSGTNQLGFGPRLIARADELDAQKMPGVLDIPGVKDYVNATPPVPDLRESSSPKLADVSSGSGQATGLRFSNDWLRKHANKHPDLDDCACPTCGAIAGACANYHNCPSGVRYDNDASKDASGRREEVGRSDNAGQPDLRSGSQEHGLRPERVGRGQHVQQVHAERQSANDHPEPGATGQVRGGPEVLSGFFASRVACDNYRRPVGILGGPCLNCGQAQPDHYKPAAPSTDAALDEAMEWLKRWEINYGAQYPTAPILSHIRQQADTIKRLEDEGSQFGAARAKLVARIDEVERMNDALRAKVKHMEEATANFYTAMQPFFAALVTYPDENGREKHG